MSLEYNPVKTVDLFEKSVWTESFDKMLNSEKYKGQSSYSQNIVQKCEERLNNVLAEQSQIKFRIKSIQDEIEIIDKQLHDQAPKHILDRLIKVRVSKILRIDQNFKKWYKSISLLKSIKSIWPKQKFSKDSRNINF